MGAAQQTFRVSGYDLGATLNSGQAFRWRPSGTGMAGVIGKRWVRLTPVPEGIQAETAQPCPDWTWLEDYLQLGTDLKAVLATFPSDAPMQSAVAACPGLRLLRQDPWECLASFILSSTKQIVQIRQIVELLCQRYGEPLPVDCPENPAYSFPSAECLSQVSEKELRACKMGFRAPYLRATAQAVASGSTELQALQRLPLNLARDGLMELPGVGRKIADCVLLFAYGFNQAFPVDVWILRALQSLYFPRRRVSLRRLHAFAAGHFGPYGGYAQQYLFHYMRTQENGRAPGLQ